MFKETSTLPLSVCVIRLSAIGDVCHAVATIQAIQRQWPDAQITWLIGKAEASLLLGLPGIEFVIFEKREAWKAYKELWKAMRNRRFDVLLHMQYALRASLASLFIKADQRIGFDRERSKELQSLFVNSKIASTPNPHVLDGFMAFAKKMGVHDLSVKWNIPVSESDESWAKSKLRTDKNDLPRNKILLICPATSKAYKNWTIEGYAAVARFVKNEGLIVAMSTGPDASEVALANKIESLLDFEIINLAGKSNLKQVYALIKEVDYLLAPDSGPAHMAVTAGTPLVGLYAHHNPQRTGPYLFRDFVVSVWADEITKQTGKTAAELPWRTRVKNREAMQNISVDSVLEKMALLIEKN